MSRARHHLRAGGGKLVKAEWEAGGKSEAAHEAEEKKRGGKVHHAEGEEAKKRADKRARGGHVKKEHKERAKGGGVKTDGVGNHAEEIHSVKHHSMIHKKGRARGGAVGADKKPLTTAAKVKHITPGEKPEKGIDNPVKESMESIEG